MAVRQKHSNKLVGQVSTCRCGDGHAAASESGNEISCFPIK